MERTHFENGMNAFPDADYRGMTLRDYFAAKAMQGMLSACTGWSEAGIERLAKCSYMTADAMLKARESK